MNFYTKNIVPTNRALAPNDIMNMRFARNGILPNNSYELKILVKSKVRHNNEWHYNYQRLKCGVWSKDLHGNIIRRNNKLRNLTNNLFNQANFSYPGNGNEFDVNNIRSVNMTFVKTAPQISNISHLFRGNSYNCYAKIIRPFLTTQKKKIMLDTYEKKIHNDGVGEIDIKMINDIAQMNCVIKDIANDNWFEDNRYMKKKTIVVYGHNFHSFLMDQNKTKLRIKYIDDLAVAYKKDKSPIKYSYINSFHTDTTLYKLKNIFLNKKDFDLYKNKLNNTHSLVQRGYEEHIRPLLLPISSRPEFNNLKQFVKCSEHNYFLLKKKSTEDNKIIHQYDQIRAYLQYKQCDLYEKFQFPCRPTHFYSIKMKSSSGKMLKYLETSGFSQITNVKIENRYLEMFKYLQDDCVYPNVLLYELYNKKYVSFSIKAIAWNANKQKIDFEIKKIGGRDIKLKYNTIQTLVDHSTNPNISLKLFQNSIIGKLIQEHTDFDVEVEISDINEVNKLVGSLNKQIISIDKINDIYKLKYTKTLDKPRSTFYYVHSYILAYQQIMLLRMALKIDFDNIRMIHCDSIFTHEPVEFDQKLWRKEKTLSNHQRFSVEISSKQIKYIGEKPNKIPWMYDKKKLFLTKGFINVSGPPGTGKSYGSMMLYNPIIACPTNELMNNFPNNRTQTIASLFDMSSTCKHDKFDYLDCHTIVLDEGSVISSDDYREIDNKITLHHCVLTLYDKNQLPPVKARSFKYKDNIVLTKIYRQKDNKFRKKLNKMIGLDPLEQIKLFKNCEGTIDEWRQGDFIVAYTNKMCDIYNKLLLAMNYPKIPVRYTKTTEKHAKNGIAILPRAEALELIENNGARMGYCNTIHAVQGKTIEKKLFIILDDIDKQHELFYTATTRVIKESLLKLIRYEINEAYDYIIEEYGSMPTDF